LLTDIVMPGGKDGVELARQAQQRWPKIAVVFTSGFSQAKPNGISPPPGTPLLSKPYRKENLAQAIQEALLGMPAGLVSADNGHRLEPAVPRLIKIASTDSPAPAEA